MLHLHNPGSAYERYFVSRYQRNGNVLAGTVVDQGGHRVDFRSGASRLIMLVSVSELKHIYHICMKRDNKKDELRKVSSITFRFPS